MWEREHTQQGMLVCMTTQPHPPSFGFTLIEALISAALLGLLMGLALPQMEMYWQQTRRQDAQNSLLQLHLKQLQWRGLHPQYSNALAELAWPGSLTLAGHYTLSLQTTGTQGYALHATAIGLQARDTNCSIMSLQYSDNTALLKTSNGATQTDPGRCWKW